MSEEQNNYPNNPFNKPKLTIPVSTTETAPAIEEEKKEAKIKKAKATDSEDDLLEISALNILMSPILHKKFKSLCVAEGISMKQKVLDFIKDEVKKDLKKK